MAFESISLNEGGRLFHRQLDQCTSAELGSCSTDNGGSSCWWPYTR